MGFSTVWWVPYNLIGLLFSKILKVKEIKKLIAIIVTIVWPLCSILNATVAVTYGSGTVQCSKPNALVRLAVCMKHWEKRPKKMGRKECIIGCNVYYSMLQWKLYATVQYGRPKTFVNSNVCIEISEETKEKWGGKYTLVIGKFNCSSSFEGDNNCWWQVVDNFDRTDRSWFYFPH